jgi:hypothetical protein
MMNYAYQGKTSPSQVAAMMARISNEAMKQLTNMMKILGMQTVEPTIMSRVP